MAAFIMATLFGMYPFLQVLFADAAYQAQSSPALSLALARI